MGNSIGNAPQFVRPEPKNSDGQSSAAQKKVDYSCAQESTEASRPNLRSGTADGKAYTNAESSDVVNKTEKKSPKVQDTKVSPVYEIWYRDKNEPPLEKIPNFPEYKASTLEELMAATSDLVITQMAVRGDIPPIDTIAPELKALKLSVIKDKAQMTCIGALKDLEVLDMKVNEGLQEIPHWIVQLKKLKSLNVSACGLVSLPDCMTQLVELEKCDMSHNRGLTKLPKCIWTLPKLTSLDMSFCGMVKLGDKKIEPDKLQFLKLSYCKKLSELPEAMQGFQSLQTLDVRGCSLTSLPTSICSLIKLEVLDISHNRLHTLPTETGKMTGLKSLCADFCCLADLPRSMEALKFLECLNIGNNVSLRELPGWIGEISSLKNLQVNACNLEMLPPSIALLKNVEEFNIDYNDKLAFLPSGIGEMKKLRRLFMRGCNLTGLPASTSQLMALEWLDLGMNVILTSIPSDVFRIPGLRILLCDGCKLLTSPPLGVCNQGLDAIRKFLVDLNENRSGNLKFIPVTVIGKSMAGKTSLVKSMQENVRVLTYRSTDNRRDEATKVFKVCEADIDENTKLVFHDFGGQAIYHLAYQLSFRSQYVPLLAINIAEFERIASVEGPEAACREVCFEWLSHLYLSCPHTGPPLVVLTHCDEIKDQETFERSCKQLIDATEELRLKIIDEENAVAPKSSPFFLMTSFGDRSKILLKSHRILQFSKTSGPEKIEELKGFLLEIGSSLLTEIPSSWYLVMQFFNEATDMPLVTLEQLAIHFPNDKDHYILQYLHKIGRVMWYCKRDTLRPYVFHRSEVLTDIIELLFDHSGQEAWDMRVLKFKPYMYGQHRINKREYTSMINQFMLSGLISDALLTNMLETESQLPAEIAIEVLKTFQLICGPIQEQRQRKYIIPYFSTRVLNVDETGQLIPLKAEICFNGLSVPSYVFYLITAAFIDLLIQPFNHIDAGMNGARILEIDGSAKYLLHSSSDQTVTLLTMCSSENVASSWHSTLVTLKHIATRLKSIWEGAHYEYVFYCSHCLLSNKECPNTTVNPEWCSSGHIQPQHSAWSFPHYTGKETCVCIAHGNTSVPLPLLYPCKSVTELGARALNEYVSEIQTLQQPQEAIQTGEAAVPSQVISSDIQDIVATVNSRIPVINLMFEPTSTASTSQNQANYLMTETRGRALIVSNSYNNTRPGSEFDYTNIKTLLQKLGFVTIGDHKNYTSTEIISTIHSETQLVDSTGEPLHRCTGAFVLVVTSHGAEGSIVGTDGKHIKITELIDLLSPKNFPSMKGKPKIVIIQACSGGKRETLLNDNPPAASASASGTDTIYLTDIQRTEDMDDDQDFVPQDISTADLIIMQSSFDSFSSPRRRSEGSVFIRALVTVFYKFAHLFHVEELAPIIREAVAMIGVQRTDLLLRSRTRRQNTETAYVASMPQTRCTFIGKKLYLQPGDVVETQSQADRDSLTNPVLPTPTATKIEQKPDTIRTERKGRELMETRYYNWAVTPNS